ncbi:MAG: hypothetical protein KGY66_05265 [Candidatus Thermoplasmatota archaeon]|nr:hypothetical protein [Candidatus Thermoplasmatota archaeon]
MKKSGWLALSGIISFSLLISTIPLYEFTLWGMDCGEYIYYTYKWVETGGAYLSIDGWANAYPFFPGMFILGGGFHLLSGIDLIRSMMFIPVVISALSPLFVFLIVYRVMDDWRPGILSAFLFTTLPPLIYGYSNPRPETLGFFLMLLVLSLNITSLERHKKTVLPIVIAFGSLIITHHLSTYFLILFFFGGVAVSKLWRRNEWPLDVLRTRLLLFFMVSTFLYWIFYSIPFGKGRIEGTLGFTSYTIVFLPFVSLIILEILTRIRRRFDIVLSIDFHKEDIRSFLIFFAFVFLLIIPVVISMTLGTLPVRDIELGTTILLYLPMVFLGLFTVSSRKIIKPLKEGPTLIGWFFFIIISMIVGFISQSSSLLPMRQFTFFLLIISFLFGIGVFHFHEVVFNPKGRKRKTLALGAVIMILVVFLIPLSYPSQEMAGGFTEGVESEDMEAAFWMKHSTSGKIAADHRISGALFSVSNQEMTWTDGDDMYFSENFSKAIADLENNNVSYIMWDEEMKKGAAIEPGQNPEPLNRTLLERYEKEFHIVYKSEEVVVYSVNYESF